MSCLDRRLTSQRNSVHARCKHAGDTWSVGSLMDETDREVSSLTERAFRSLCIGEEAVYNDSEFASSPGERQQAFGGIAQGKEALGPGTQEPLSLGLALQNDHLSHRSNGALQTTWLHKRSQSKVSSLIKAFSSTGSDNEANREVWDASALLSIQGELRDLSSASFPQDVFLGHFAQAEGPNQSSKTLTSNADLSPASGKRSKGTGSKSSRRRKLNPKNSFLHSEHSPFQSWRDCNRLSFPQECRSDLLSSNDFPRWYDSPLYKELTATHGAQASPPKENRQRRQQTDSTGPVALPSPGARQVAPVALPSPGARQVAPVALPSPGARQVAPVALPSPEARQVALVALPSPEARQVAPVALPSPGARQVAPVALPSPGARQVAPVALPSPGARQVAPVELPSPGARQVEPVALPSPGARQVAPVALPSPGARQVAPVVDTRCTSEAGATATPWRKSRNVIKETPPSNRPRTTTPGLDWPACGERGLVSVSKAPLVAEERKCGGMTPFSISQLLTPIIHARQETQTSDILKCALSPSDLDPLSLQDAEVKPAPEVKLRDSYKSMASSLLFNIKDNRKRVKSMYSPPKFKSLDTVDRDRPPTLQETAVTENALAISEACVAGVSSAICPGVGGVQAVCSPVQGPANASTANRKKPADSCVSDGYLTLSSPQPVKVAAGYRGLVGGICESRDQLAESQSGRASSKSSDVPPRQRPGYQSLRLNSTVSPAEDEIRGTPPTLNMPWHSAAAREAEMSAALSARGTDFAKRPVHSGKNARQTISLQEPRVNPHKANSDREKSAVTETGDVTTANRRELPAPSGRGLFNSQAMDADVAKCNGLETQGNETKLVSDPKRENVVKGFRVLKEKEYARKEVASKHAFSTRQNQYIKNERYAMIEGDPEEKGGDKLTREDNYVTNAGLVTEEHQRHKRDTLRENKYGQVHAETCENRLPGSDVILAKEHSDAIKHVHSMKGNTLAKSKMFANKEHSQTRESRHSAKEYTVKCVADRDTKIRSPSEIKRGELPVSDLTMSGNHRAEKFAVKTENEYGEKEQKQTYADRLRGKHIKTYALVAELNGPTKEEVLASLEIVTAEQEIVTAEQEVATAEQEVRETEKTQRNERETAAAGVQRKSTLGQIKDPSGMESFVVEKEYSEKRKCVNNPACSNRDMGKALPSKSETTAMNGIAETEQETLTEGRIEQDGNNSPAIKSRKTNRRDTILTKQQNSAKETLSTNENPQVEECMLEMKDEEGAKRNVLTMPGQEGAKLKETVCEDRGRAEKEVVRERVRVEEMVTEEKEDAINEASAEVARTKLSGSTREVMDTTPKDPVYLKTHHKVHNRLSEPDSSIQVNAVLSKSSKESCPCGEGTLQSRLEKEFSAHSARGNGPVAWAESERIGNVRGKEKAELESAELQYYAVSDGESKTEAEIRQVASPQGEWRGDSQSSHSEPDGGGWVRSLIEFAKVQTEVSQAGSLSSPVERPALFKVKDNAFRTSPVTKAVKPRFHKLYPEEFTLGSPEESRCGSERGDDEQDPLRDSADSRENHILQSAEVEPANNPNPTPIPPVREKRRSRRGRHVCAEEEESRSSVSGVSEEAESGAAGTGASTAEVPNGNATHADDPPGSTEPSERSESVCSTAEAQTQGKPPAVPPKSEKALRRALRLTTRRIKKAEAQVKTEGESRMEPTPSPTAQPSSVPGEPPSPSPHTHSPTTASQPCAKPPSPSPHTHSPTTASQPCAKPPSPSPHTHSPTTASQPCAKPPSPSPHTHSPTTASQPCAKPPSPSPHTHSPTTASQPCAKPPSPSPHTHSPTTGSQPCAESIKTRLGPNVVTEPFPLTQRRLLQDPDSGQYFMVDMPVQVRTKTFFDPETGSYIQLPVHAPKKTPSQATPMGGVSAPYMLYHGFVPVPVSSLQPQGSAPADSTEEQAELEGSESRDGPRRWEGGKGSHCREAQPYIEPAYGSHDHLPEDWLYSQDKDRVNSKNVDIMSLGDLDDFSMEKS